MNREIPKSEASQVSPESTLETKENNTLDDFAVQEMELLENVPEERMEQLTRAGKLQRWIGAMVMTTALAGFFGSVPEAQAQGRRTRQITRVGVEIYEGMERDKLAQMDKQRRELLQALRVVEREIKFLGRQFQKDIKSAQQANDQTKIEELQQSFDTQMQELEDARDKIQSDLETIERKIESHQRKQRLIREGTRILGRILR